MAQVLIRNLDPQVVEALRERAKANGRSLEAELRALLQRESSRSVAEKSPAYGTKPKGSLSIHPPKHPGPRKPFQPIKLRGKGKLPSQILIEERR